MSLLEDLPLIVVVLGAIPLAWSGIVYALHAGAARLREPRIASMRLEAAALASMIAPVIVGGVLLVSPPLPADAPIPVLDLPEMSFEPGVVVELQVGAADAAPSAGLSRPMLSLAILAIYLTGLAVCALRLARARHRLDRIARESAFAPQIGDRVRLTDETASPFASACGAVILPRALAEKLPARELALIIEHERAHLDRGDPRSFWTLAWVDALFWFNPFVRRQTARCRLAAELACDAAVVGSAPGVRSAYAGVLVAAMKHAVTDGPRWAPGMLPGRGAGAHRLRLTHIMRAAPGQRSPLARMAVAAAALLVVPVGGLQLVACAAGGASPDIGATSLQVGGVVLAPSSFVITTVDDDEVVVERTSDRITLTGPLVLDTGDSTIAFQQVDLVLVSSGSGAPTVSRIESPRAIVTPANQTGEPAAADGTVEMLQVSFAPACGGTLSLPLGLGQFPMGVCPRGAAAVSARASTDLRFDADEIRVSSTATTEAETYSATPLILEMLPVDGAVSAEFGKTRNPTTGEEAAHTGVDISAPRDAPVVAPAAGRVTFVGWRGGYGRVVEMDHGGDVKSRYGHLQRALVEVGDEVAAGELIGRVGSTGSSDGPNLYWEIWHRGLAFDPAPMMAALGAE